MPIITKVLSFFYFGTEGIVRIAYLLVALAVIAISMYFLGGQAYLNGAWGTDTRSAIGMLVWLDKYFPNIPFWYPLSGGGISLTHSYPVFSLYLSSLLRSLSSLNIIQSFTLIGFSSVLAMAISIYFFAALRFKNQTAGLIASIFYLISPIAWTWLVDWGFYAESVSHIFVGPAIIFWDFFFVSFLHKNFGVRTRLYLLLTVVFLSIAMALHFLEGFALLRFFFFYVLVFPLFYKGERKKVFLKGLTALLLVAVFSYLATLIFSVPFQNYQKISSQVGLSGGGTLKDISQALPGPEYVLGFKTYLQNDFLFAMRRFSFPAIVSLLAIAATVFFAWRDKRMATLGIYAAYAFLLSLTPYYYWYLGKYLPSFLALFVTSGTGWREMFIILRIVLPVLAALAITKFVSLPLFWLKNKYFKAF